MAEDKPSDRFQTEMMRLMQTAIREINGLKSNLGNLDNKFDGLDKKFDGLETRFDGLDKKFDGLETRFDGLEKKFDGLENKVDQLGTKVDEIDDKVKKNNYAIRVIDGNLTLLSNQFSDVVSKVITDHKRIDSLEDRVDNLESGIH
jgi:chromosome segregation ATPase